MKTCRLPYDVSRCNGSRCEVRNLCARFTADSPVPVPISDFSAIVPLVQRVDACENHISNARESEE